MIAGITIHNVLIAVPVLCYAIYILWQVLAWLKLPPQKWKVDEPITRISLIIPARNESGNISNCIDSLLKQNYPHSLLEIIVVDDHSEDDTINVAEKTLTASEFKWKIIRLPETVTNKKNAISTGIRESDGELIVITDADCTSGINWIRSIAATYEQKHYKMMCGPVILDGNNRFLPIYQGLEMAGLMVLAGGGISSTAPLLCNGANIAYTRKAYNEVKGFEGIDTLPTGDDTLLMFKINKAYPGQVGFIKSKDAIVSSQPQPDWNSFFHQRIRWASKGFRSASIINSLISMLVFVTNMLLLVYVIGALVYFHIDPVFLACLIVKFTVDFLLLTCGCIFIDRRKFLAYFLAGEFVTMTYVVWIGMTSNFLHYKWKGRTY